MSDKYFIGFTLSDRTFQLFASNWSTERTLREAGYDLYAGPFDTKQQATQALDEFEAYRLRAA